MSSLSQPTVSSDRSQIAALRKAWVDAVIAEDIDGLIAMVTDDVAAVHGSGQCSCGKDELKKDFLHILARWDVEHTHLSSELVVHDNWAVEIDEIETTRAPLRDGTAICTHFKAVFVFRRQSDDSWKIARILELAD